MMPGPVLSCLSFKFRRSLPEVFTCQGSLFAIADPHPFPNDPNFLRGNWKWRSLLSYFVLLSGTRLGFFWFFFSPCVCYVSRPWALTERPLYGLSFYFIAPSRDNFIILAFLVRMVVIILSSLFSPLSKLFYLTCLPAGASVIQTIAFYLLQSRKKATAPKSDTTFLVRKGKRWLFGLFP